MIMYSVDHQWHFELIHTIQSYEIKSHIALIPLELSQSTVGANRGPNQPRIDFSYHKMSRTSICQSIPGYGLTQDIIKGPNYMYFEKNYTHV